MSATAQYEISGLLEQAGANPRGNRHDCPKCGGLRTVTHSGEAFYCHRCEWKGNAVKLAKELGLYERLPRAEYVRQRAAREQAESQARQFLADCKARRRAFEGLYIEMQNLCDEYPARLDPEDESAWDGLEWVYKNEREVLATIILLGEGAIAPRRRWLEAAAEERERIIEEILLTGGLHDPRGNFIEFAF